MASNVINFNKNLRNESTSGEGKDNSFIFDTPEPESYDSIGQYKFYKALKEADGNASGLERQINEEEYEKFIQGDFNNVDMTKAENHHDLINAILEDMKREFKGREQV